MINLFRKQLEKGTKMQKIYNLFRKYLPIVLVVSSIALVFGLLSLIYYYNESTVSIDFKNVVPIFTVILMAIAVLASIIFTSKVDKLHITKIKKSFGLCKFASLLAATLAAALFFFDFFRFVLNPGQFSSLRIIRLLVFIPFVVYIVLNVIPKKVKTRRIELPHWLKPITAICTIVWSILGLLMIYFWQELPTTNLFKLIFLFYYVIVTLFFMFEIKFEISSPVVKGYVITALLLFVYTFAVIGPLMIAKFLGRLTEVTISEFEIFLAFALGIYAFAKLVAMQQTMKFVMKNNGTSHGHHHHHHHHHKHTDKPVTDEVTVPAESTTDQAEAAKENN